MIKIEIPNLNQKKQEYSDAITPLMAFRVSVLQQSLSHLDGAIIDFGTGHFVNFKPVTRKIIEIVGDPLPDLNTRTGYVNAVNNYRFNPNGLGTINIDGLLQFCSYLLANNNQELSNLLVCDAGELMNLNNQLLNNYGINAVSNKAVLRLAFNYEIDDTIGPRIRQYFRSNSFIKICPYCNMEPVTHQINSVNQVVRSYELDHFYDKARYPLLCYSFFNLVPSDHTCNVTNKGVTEFTDDYHLNPHFMGYVDSIRFVPTGLTPTYEVNAIEVELLEAQGTPLYRKINGHNLPNVEGGELGNLNVFQIRHKYSDQMHLANTIFKVLRNENTYFRYIKKYVDKLTGLDLKKNYQTWYEKEFGVRFKSIDFNEKKYSKFYRSIHDYYIINNKNRWNRYIVDLIEDL